MSEQENWKFAELLKFDKVVSMKKYEELMNERVAILFTPFLNQNEKCRYENFSLSEPIFIHF